jgi:hypothetical protein
MEHDIAVLGNRRNLNINILGETAVLHFALPLFCGWGHVKLSLQILGITALSPFCGVGCAKLSLKII